MKTFCGKLWSAFDGLPFLPARTPWKSHAKPLPNKISWMYKCSVKGVITESETFGREDWVVINLSICKTYGRLEQSTATCENCRSKHQEENSLITILKNTVILITVTKYHNTHKIADFTMIKPTIQWNSVIRLPINTITSSHFFIV